MRPGQSWAGLMATVASAVLGLMAQLGFPKAREFGPAIFQVCQIRLGVCSERVLAFFFFNVSFAFCFPQAVSQKHRR